MKSILADRHVHIVAMLGPPGSGKDLNSSWINAEVPMSDVFSSGDVVRGQERRYLKYKRLMEEHKKASASGAYVPDAPILEATKREFRAMIARDITTILSTGAPRTPAQLAELENYYHELGKKGCAIRTTYLQLVAKPETAIARAANRVEEARQKGVEPRRDDHVDVVQRRLDEFETLTRPMLNILEGRGDLVVVDAEGTIKDVRHKVLTALNIVPKFELIAR
jgi:adenylate kinase